MTVYEVSSNSLVLQTFENVFYCVMYQCFVPLNVGTQALRVRFRSFDLCNSQTGEAGLCDLAISGDFDALWQSADGYPGPASLRVHSRFVKACVCHRVMAQSSLRLGSQLTIRGPQGVRSCAL